MIIELQDDTKDRSYYAAGLATYSIVGQLFLYTLRYLRTRSVKNRLESIRLQNLIRPKKRCFTRVILRLLHIAILERLSRRLIVVEMTLQVEYIEAKSPKERVQYLNSFLEHIDKHVSRLVRCSNESVF